MATDESSKATNETIAQIAKTRNRPYRDGSEEAIAIEMSNGLCALQETLPMKSRSQSKRHYCLYKLVSPYRTVPALLADHCDPSTRLVNHNGEMALLQYLSCQLFVLIFDVIF